MTDKERKKEVPDRPKRKKSALRRFIGATITAFFLGILMLIIVNIFQWSSKGYEGMMNNLNNYYQVEISSLMARNKTIAIYAIAIFNLTNDKFTQVILNSKKEIQALKTSSKPNLLRSVLNVKNNIEDKAQQFNQHTKSNFISGMLDETFRHVKQAGYMLRLTFVILFFKFLNIFAAMLIYIFASLFGALDGLVARYVRTAEGGRESTFIFHKMTDVIIQLPIWLIAIYLISPILINPVIVIALLALSFFVVFNIATSNLKKFL